MKSSGARAYHMTARAEAAAETHQRIVDTAVRILADRLYDEVSLGDIAGAAGVTVQTVLRRFGSKEALAEAAAEAGRRAIRAERFRPTPGDVAGGLRVLLEHYETWGDRSLRFLAQEERVVPMRRVVEAGRALHHEWVDHVFAPHLRAARGEARVRLRARLIAATDVYTWKIFRRDLRLDARATERTLRELLDAILS